jgi:hypothetical protein
VRRYIHEYVTCKTCKSPDTLLAKENRVWFIACESCGSKRSVSAIKTGFQAQTTVCAFRYVLILETTSFAKCGWVGWYSWHGMRICVWIWFVWLVSLVSTCYHRSISV